MGTANPLYCAYCKQEIKPEENVVWINYLPYHWYCLFRNDTSTKDKPYPFIIKTSYTIPMQS